MKPEETLDFHIRWLWSKIARLYNAEAAKFGGSMSVGYILLNIDKEGTPSTKLGPKMGMESRSLTRTLKLMEEQGLIERRPDSEDKRLAKVFLTAEGKRFRKTSKDVVIRFNEFLQSQIGAETFDQFLHTAARINHIIERNHIFKDMPYSTSEPKNHPLSKTQSPKNP